MNTTGNSSGADDLVKELSLDGLPMIILDQIFKLVQSPELVKIASLSKSLYWPAVNRIYRNITIYYAWSQDNEDDPEGSYDLRDKSEWEINYGTVVKIQRLEQLICTLTGNPQLAHLIKKVNIQGDIIRDTYVHFLRLIPDLKCLNDDLGCLPAKSIPGNLEKVTCSVNIAPKFSTNIVELRLIDYGDGEFLFQGIARDLITSQGYKTLRKLQFLDFDFSKFPQMSFPFLETGSILPNWTVFFDEFVAQGVKLYLTSLGLCGDLSDDKVRITQQLRKSIDLEGLITLVSMHAESVEQSDTKETFTEMITKHTPRIDSLEICVTDGSEESLIRAIVNTLTLNLPNQLKELSLSYFRNRNNEEHVWSSISDAILSSQRNLVKLKIENGFWFKPYEKSFTFLEDLEEAIEAMKFPWVSASNRARLFPRIMDTPHRVPYIPQNNREYIYNEMYTIRKSLRRDRIYTKAADQMPFLTQYYYGRLFIDVKKRGLIVNGETTPFEDYADVDFISSGSDSD